MDVSLLWLRHWIRWMLPRSSDKHIWWVLLRLRWNKVLKSDQINLQENVKQLHKLDQWILDHSKIQQKPRAYDRNQHSTRTRCLVQLLRKLPADILRGVLHHKVSPGWMEAKPTKKRDPHLQAEKWRSLKSNCSHQDGLQPGLVRSCCWWERIWQPAASSLQLRERHFHLPNQRVLHQSNTMPSSVVQRWCDQESRRKGGLPISQLQPTRTLHSNWLL